MKRRLLPAFVTGMLMLAALPSVAEANTRYTGCLWTGIEIPGQITRVAIGGSPAAACDPRYSRQISWLRDPERGAQGDRGARGTRGLRGAQGQRGETGDPGPRGAGGESGTFSVYTVTSPCGACEGLTEKTAEVSCDRGDVALGGGFISDGLIQGSRADDDGPVRSWSVAAIVEPEGSSGAQAQLVCQDLPPLRS